MEKKINDQILLLQTESLENYLRIKSRLQENNISYEDKVKDDSILGFAAKMMTLGRPATGFESHQQIYKIYIDKKDYEKASTLVGKQR